jgi:hypothetical protein
MQGSTTVTDSTNTSRPWQQEYYKRMLAQAENLYNQGMPQQYQGPTVAGFTPAQMESMNLTSNYVTGGAQDMMNNQNRIYQQMMSGQVDTGAGSPYANMADAYKRQAVGQAQDAMAELRTGQVAYQPGGSSRAELLNERVMEDTNQGISDNLASMYGNAYDQAQQKQVQALGQYGSIMNMPLEMSKQLYNRVGLPQQTLNQALMDDQKRRYDYNAMSPYNNLAQFQSFISGNYGGQNIGTSTSTATPL